MIRLDVAQGSEEWLAARLGRPTASGFYRIFTPGGKVSAAADGYLAELLAEWALGAPLDVERGAFMERGSELEAQAVGYYELLHDCTVDRVGFALTDDRSAGCSPDAFVGDVGGLEIKVPGPATHVAYLLEDVPAKYRPQIQGGLFVTDRAWWDFLSWHPTLPPALVRVHRDEEYLASMSLCLRLFTERLEAGKERLRALGVVPVVNPFTPAELLPLVAVAAREGL